MLYHPVFFTKMFGGYGEKSRTLLQTFYVRCSNIHGTSFK